MPSQDICCSHIFTQAGIKDNFNTKVSNKLWTEDISYRVPHWSFYCQLILLWNIMHIFSGRRFNLVHQTIYIRGNEFVEIQFCQSIEANNKPTIWYLHLFEQKYFWFWNSKSNNPKCSLIPHWLRRHGVSTGNSDSSHAVSNFYKKLK